MRQGLAVTMSMTRIVATVLGGVGQDCNKGELTAGHTHDTECGFVPAVEGHPCNFGVTISVSEGNAAVASHSHDGECGYKEAVEAQECTCGAFTDGAASGEEESGADVSGGDAGITHAADCEYREAVEEQPCKYADHTAHNEECEYREAVEEHCNFDFSTLHTEHNAECGYVPAEPASPCNHVHNAACGGLDPVSVDMTEFVDGRIYTSSAEQVMAYYYSKPLNTDILGQYKGQWIQTTFDYSGYQVVSKNMTGAVVEQRADFVNGGQYVQLNYTVTAGDRAITAGKLAVHADVQISDDDYATIKVIKDSSGSKVLGVSMVDAHNNCEASTQGAQYNLYFRGTAGVTDVSTYWFGYYGIRQSNCYNQLPKNAQAITTSDNGYDSEAESYSGMDSGIAVSWQNIELAPGQSKTYSIIVGVGEASEPPKYNKLLLDAELQDRYTVNVEANIKDQPGVIDYIYYTIDDGVENKLLDSTATGEEQTVEGTIKLPELDHHIRHKILLWIANSKGAMSEAVEKWIEVDEDGKVKVDDHTHDYEDREEIKPKCTEDGYVKERCKECKEWIVTKYEPALGHDFSEYVYNNDAAYDHDGTETATCARGCKATHTRTKPNTKLILPEDKVIEGDITGKDTYESVTAKLVGIHGMGGREYPATVTGGGSLYHYHASAPADEYNLVVTAVKKDGTTITITSIVKLMENITKDIELPKGEKNSRVVIKENTRTVLVGELDNIANESGTEADVVKVEFTVEEKTEEAADGAQQIKNISEGRILEYLDFKLTRQINDNPKEDIGDSNKKLLPIVVPFERGDKENLAVYRYHKGEAKQLTKTPNENGEYIEFSENKVLIHAMKFSTYAIGYTLPEEEDEPIDGVYTLVQRGEIVKKGPSEPKTGVSRNAVPWATVGMIAGFTYLLDLFADKSTISLGMTEEQKNRVIAWIVKNAKHKNRYVRYLAIGVIFMILLFYHLIGKHLSAKDELRELQAA